MEIVIPVYNEERAVGPSLRRLHSYLSERFPLSWVLTVVDNASTDRTLTVATEMAALLEGVRVVHLDAKGRGRALRSAWMASTATTVAYMDVDLSTDLDALLPLVAPILTGHSDVAIGTRLAPGARVVRSPKREFISRSYNLVLRTALRCRFSDAQCGFKALRRDVAHDLLPLVEDQGWFFDTEILILAERNGLRIHEVPVDWVDDPDSRVEIASTAREDLKGVGRLLLSFTRGQGRIGAGPARPVDQTAGQALHFASVGAASTVAFTVLFVLLYGPLGPVGADLGALALSSAGNVAANRRYTFDAPASRHFYRQAAVLAALPFVTTVAALLAGRWAGMTGLVGAVVLATGGNLAATALRFRGLRHL